MASVSYQIANLLEKVSELNQSSRPTKLIVLFKPIKTTQLPDAKPHL